jgi:glycosyltransferase involved in cell wall biosynthesis
MAGLCGEDGTTRAVIVGEGPLRGALEGRRASLGLDGAVTFWGERRDARSLLQEFDVPAVPSRAEGTPLTILEAMGRRAARGYDGGRHPGAGPRRP